MGRAALALLLGVGGCTPPVLADACREAGAAPRVVAQLLFGLSRPDHGVVTAAQWQRFVDTHVTPRFPLGFTVLDGAGQWRGDDGKLVHEASKLVLIVPDPLADSATDPAAAPGTAASGRLQAIRDEYRAEFAQDSVGLVLTSGCAAF